jgi:tetratricopeptide (TPR) repeat protein
VMTRPCQAAPAGFVEGNDFYKKGDYDRALERYAAVLNNGLESSGLYFNMGNCYFKKKEWGKAILNYERAARLSPRDPDIDFNERLVFQKIPSVPLKSSGALIHRLSGYLFGWFSVDEVTLGLTACYVLCLFLIATAAILPKRSPVPWRWGNALILLIFLFGITLLYDRIKYLGREAIVVAKTTTAKFEPLPDATTYFELREGMKVAALEDQKEWIKIRRADGKTGWILRKTQEII